MAQSKNEAQIRARVEKELKAAKEELEAAVEAEGSTAARRAYYTNVISPGAKAELTHALVRIEVKGKYTVGAVRAFRSGDVQGFKDNVFALECVYGSKNLLEAFENHASANPDTGVLNKIVDHIRSRTAIYPGDPETKPTAYLKSDDYKAHQEMIRFLADMGVQPALFAIAESAGRYHGGDFRDRDTVSAEILKFIESCAPAPEGKSRPRP